MTVNQLGQLCASASVSASITGFAPNGNFANLTATNSSASVALPAGAVVIFQNTGTTTVSCTVGIGSATALVSEVQIPASSSVPFTVGSNTFGACIDQTGSASNVIALAGGAGLFTGFGGGGGGSGGAVTNAGTFAVQLTGATNNINNIAGTVSLPTGAATSALQTTGNTSLTTINTTLGTPMQQTGGSVSVANANANGQATAANSSPVVAPVLTVAGAAVVKGGVPVVNGASIGNTIAASQTAQIMSATQAGGTGATGDYISHCLIQPTTTAAGTVTVLDNATVMYTFTTGTLSNLATIPVPLGMVSVSGAWKVTTGANEIVTCVGKFS